MERSSSTFPQTHIFFVPNIKGLAQMVLTWKGIFFADADADAVETNWKHKVTPGRGDLITPKLRKLIEHNHMRITSEGRYGTSACWIPGHSLLCLPQKMTINPKFDPFHLVKIRQNKKNHQNVVKINSFLEVIRTHQYNKLQAIPYMCSLHFTQSKFRPKERNQPSPKSTIVESFLGVVRIQQHTEFEVISSMRST